MNRPPDDRPGPPERPANPTERPDDPLEPPEPPGRSQKERMLAGDLYCADDPELIADAERAARWMDRYNASTTLHTVDRLALLRERLGAVGDGTVVRPPFYVDYGTNIMLGRKVFLNFGCTILDVVSVSIGDRTLIAPNVQILAADHPRELALRVAGQELGRPIVVGEDVWIGAGAILLPGVSVGDAAVIGAGAVVTRDVPAGVTVAGNPARPLAR